jgi:hypothetical protein
MFKKHHILAAFVALLVVSLACSQVAPAAAPPDPNAVNTSIALTVAARQTEAVLNNPSTATVTLAPVTPTLSPTLEPTLSTTPDFTPTIETPLITVSVDTNCRAGPGSIFERVGMLLEGETAEVVGREPKGEYWYIRNPDEGLEYCWVWGEYATVTGNTLPLLYMSPAAPPASSFAASFAKLETCTVYWVDIKLTNNSAGNFESVALELRDADTNTLATMAENKFTHKTGCEVPVMTDALVAGATFILSSPPLGYNPSGHNLSVKVTVCTDANQQGICLTQTLSFKP